MDNKRNTYINELFKSGFVPAYLHSRLPERDEWLFNEALGDIWLIICALKENKYDEFKDFNAFRRFTSGIICRYVTKTGGIQKLKRLYRLEKYANPVRCQIEDDKNTDLNNTDDYE